jgi:hypothetical protein
MDKITGTCAHNFAQKQTGAGFCPTPVYNRDKLFKNALPRNRDGLTIACHKKLLLSSIGSSRSYNTCINLNGSIRSSRSFNRSSRGVYFSFFSAGFATGNQSADNGNEQELFHFVMIFVCLTLIRREKESNPDPKKKFPVKGFF